MNEIDQATIAPKPDEDWKTRRKRLRLYAVPDTVMAEVFAGRVNVPEIPADARTCGVFFDIARECVVVKVWSDSFAPVPEAGRIPYGNATLERTTAP